MASNSIPSVIQTAIQKRENLLTPDTNALRLLDGIGDGLADTFLETFADKWIISTRQNQLSPDIRKALEQTGKTVYWKCLDQHNKENPSHLAGIAQDEPFLAKETGVNYEMSFQSGYSQGIFLDQRLNRVRVREHSHQGSTILNTFAYTGAFSVCAALNGATTTTLDLSQPYLDWAKRNLQANDLDPSEHYFCKGDTFHWLQRFAKQGRKFDGIILDPPTFSRDHKGKVFRVESHYDQLIKLASQCLSKDGWILATTNCRKLEHQDFTQLVKKGLSSPAKIKAHPMPPEYNGEDYLKTLWIQS